MAKRILVTGGLGFIGLQLCRQLLLDEPDAEVTIVDNLSSTRLDYSPLKGKADIHIADMRTIEESSADYHEIYHLASPVGSIGILERNGYIASDILELASKAARLAMVSGAKLLYISSSEVYGRDGQHTESTELLVPDKRGARMEYSLGKLAAEHVLFNLASDDQFEVRVVRPFNVAGEWQSAQLGFVIPRFFTAALTGTPLMVHGDGMQRRSFCHVSDLAKGAIAVQNQASANEVYNVGNPDNITTIDELAHHIVAITRSTSSIEHIDPCKTYGKRYMEAFDKIPDISKIMQCSNWSPTLNLQQILERSHHFFSSESAPAQEKQSQKLNTPLKNTTTAPA